MEDEDFSATKATPFPGRKKSLAKEGVTRIGNNTYYYTGEKISPWNKVVFKFEKN